MTLCPCCGFKFFGDLRDGCKQCGARAIGDPLPRPDYELPDYGRSLLLVVTGVAVVLWFFSQIIFAMAENGFSLYLESWIAAAETAAWRVKWLAMPITVIVLWGGLKVYRSMLDTPSRFVGIRSAGLALLASALIILLIVTLIAITVPARLRRQQMMIEATELAQKHSPNIWLEFKT